MSSVTVSTYALTYNTTHTVTYVTGKMLLVLKEIIRGIGLDPGKLTDRWGSLELAISTWLRSQHLTKLCLEIYNGKTDALVSRWDLDVVYGYGSDDTFWADTEAIRYTINKAGLVPSACDYCFILYTKPGRPDVDGWGLGETRSTDGFRRYSVGATIGGNGICRQRFDFVQQYDRRSVLRMFCHDRSKQMTNGLLAFPEMSADQRMGLYL